MLIYENIRLALFSLKANKMRALLTMLGIIIGIASVIAIMTVGNSITTFVSDTMSSMGASNITVGLQQKQEEEETTREGVSFGGRQRMKTAGEDDYFTKEMLENYCDTYADSVSAISAQENIGSGQILEEQLYANVSVSGVSLGYFLANDMNLTDGRFFSEKETDDGKMVAIVSDKVVNNMYEGDKEKALGSIFQANINEKYYQCTIIGIYEYEQSAMSFSTVSEKDISTNVYIPLKAAQNINHKTGYTQFTVVTKADVDADSFAEKTESFFTTYYRKNNDFAPSAYSMSTMVESMTEMLSTITLAISIIAGIALLVGGIGVMNIMLVSITERTREIGTRKALGAPNSSIRLQFIVESIVICTIGGIIGIILGIIMGSVAANLMETPASPSIGSIILSLTFSMAIGVFFGYHPANKAAKMDPIEALRYE